MAAVQLGAKAIGSTVKIKVDGSPRNFIVVHQGLPSSLYDASCNGTWLLMEEIFEEREWHSSHINNYATSTIHSYLNGTFLNRIDREIRENILQVKIPYTVRDNNLTVYSGANGLTATVFLLSLHEAGFTTADYSGLQIDGARLAYFQEGMGADACKKRIVYVNGIATAWWTRSIYAGYVYCVTQVGEMFPQVASRSMGIRPTFLLPFNMLVTDDGTVTVNEAPTTPGSITVPNVIKGGDSVAISWAASTDPDNNLEGYRLERQVNTGTWGQIYQGSAISHTDSITQGWNTVAYRVKAYDALGAESGYRTSDTRTVINNAAPQISGSNTHLGAFSETGITHAYTVTDDQDVTLTVVERLDGAVLRSYTATAGQQNTLELTGTAWRHVLNGTHTLTITATDSQSESATRTLQFLKNEPVYRFRTISPTAEESRPVLLAMKLVGEAPEGATEQYLACNNGLDASPAWEDITAAVKAGLNHSFQNREKTADKWAVRFQIATDRQELAGDCYTSAMTYAYRTVADMGWTWPDNVGSFKAVEGANQITLTWSDPEDTVADGEVVAQWAGTKIVRGEGRCPTDENDGALVANSTTRNQHRTTGLVDSGLQKLVEYCYQAFPYSNEGFVNRSAANRVSATLGLTPPGNVTGFAAVGGSKQVTLTWADPDDQGAPAPAVWAGTMIRRKTGGYPTSETDGALVVDSKTRNQYRSGGFVDVGLINGTEYFYSAFPYSDTGVFNRSTASRASVALKWELAYYGNTSNLNEAHAYPAAASAGDYAIIGGGISASADTPAGAISATMTAYSSSLTRSTPDELHVRRWSAASAISFGNYALFTAGDVASKGNTPTASVTSYNQVLTRGTPAALSIAKYSDVLGVSVGTYALYGGGTNNSGGITTSVDAYNTSLVRSTAPALSNGQGSAAQAGRYAVFTGLNAVTDAYSDTLVRTTAPSLSVPRSLAGAARAGSYAVFVGGSASSPYGTLAEAYSAGLVRSTAASLSVGRVRMAIASIEEMAVFAGGTNGSNLLATVDVYDSSLTRSTSGALSIARQDAAAAAAGSYVLIGGGRIEGGATTIPGNARAVVDVYTVK